jgi:uncharacterized MAPEG superfamily protein
VTAQLAKVRNAVNLQGNPWVCDRLMYSTMYSWCANNSVNWSLVCSSPSRFKGKLWTIYEEEGCYDDGDHTDVKNNTTNDDILSKRTDDKNNTQWPSVPAPTQIPEGNMQNNSVYLYCIIGLSVVILCLLITVILLYWHLKVARSRRERERSRRERERSPTVQEEHELQPINEQESLCRE